MYTTEIIWLLTWPIFIYMSLKLSQYFIGKIEEE